MWVGLSKRGGCKGSEGVGGEIHVAGLEDLKKTRAVHSLRWGIDVHVPVSRSDRRSVISKGTTWRGSRGGRREPRR